MTGKDWSELGARARATRERADKVVRVYDTRVFAGMGDATGRDMMATAHCATVWIRYPTGDGAGPTRVLVADWGPVDEPYENGCVYYASHASGYGYDKITAALAGCKVAGITLGDHCNPAGNPQLDTLQNAYPHMAVI